MQVKLVFDDWVNGDDESIYDTPLAIELISGDLHHGSTFEAALKCDADTMREIKTALAVGIYPKFSLRAVEE